MVTDLTDDWSLEIKTQLGNYPPCSSCSYPDDYATYEQSASTISGGVDVTTVKETSTSTTAQITSSDSLGAENATYRFTVTPTLAIPTEGVMVLTVPSGVTVPSNSVSGFTMDCNDGCTLAGSLDYDSSTRLLTIENAFGSYLVGGSSDLSFDLTGWTNPTDQTTQEFSLEILFDDGSSTLKGIENFTGLELGASDGVCYVQYANVTDADTRIYAQPYGYSFQMWCTHDLTTDMGLQVVFPSDYIVMDRSSCTFFLEGYSYSRYICETLASTNTIQVTSFLGADIAAETVIKFTVDSIINPGTYGSTGEIKINTIDSSDTVVDQGAWIFDAGFFTAGTVTKFTVTPQSSGVGEDPVKYDFNVQPNGEIPRYGYLQIDLPDEVTITNERYFEDSCGENLEAFTNTVISCVVMNSKRSIQIKDGFLYQASTNLTDSDGLYFPPDMYFTLEGFKNPRATGYTSPWNVTVYNDSQKQLYYWQAVDAPTIRVSGIAAPSYIEPFFENRQNGAFSYIEFLVTTTGGLSEGDRIVIKLPTGWQFSTDSSVLGVSNNMASLMESNISSDQRQIDFTVELSPIVQRLLFGTEDTNGIQSGNLPINRKLQAKLPAGYSFQFRITEMKNFYSLRPSTESIEYYVYSADGVLFEEETDGMTMANNEVGKLDPNKNGILPADFRTDFEAVYTLTVQVSNFETNMVFTVFLPEEINFTEDDPQCFGISGTDEDVLRCETQRSTRSLKFTNAMQFKQANPGPLTIQIENLMNPSENVITKSFGMTTETADGFAMDELYEGMTINFYCEYPCASCPEGSPTTCDSCYQTAVERYFFEAQCLSECPDKMVETDDLTCTDCISPCVTCNGTPNSCVTCIEGWYIVNGDQCREEIFWPFPFVGTAILFFILISISECATKRESNFKESLIAFWSLPEVGSWGTLIYFMWDNIGQSEATAMAALAALIYVCINAVHAILHPRYMVPNALDSYKKVLADYSCGSGIARAISYLLSFKFSLILVSNFFGSQRLKGDYSAMNWKQFNRFSLFFCLLPYPCMMASCIYFIATEGFWSYAGFVAAEVVCLSSIMTILLAIDAISAIKCKTVGKRKVVKEVNVATAADYESDEEERNLKRQVRDAHRRKENDVFGGDDDYDVEDDSHYRSQLSQQTQIMNEEARKQIQMLEELAHQMREEKRQLQLDKERIEREKMQLDADRSRSQQNIENYMEDYQRQAMVLSNQVAEMERQKVDLVQQVESRLEEGNRANMILALKVQEAQQLQQKKELKNFRDFEGEMDDYEPVEEAASNEEEEPPVRDMVQMPVEPAHGQIDYYRTVEESAQWMQQITPRAGGVSMLGDDQHMGMEADMELAMEKNATAHFETASVPPSMTAIEMGKGRHDAEFQELTSQFEAAQSEEYHQRSDAEMEIDSEVVKKEDGFGQEFFEKERAVYSAVGDCVEKDSQAEFFTNVEDAVYEQLEKPATRHGNEQRYFAQVEPKIGEADERSEVFGSTQHFFKPEPPTYGVDDEGSVELQATDQHFFNHENAQKGVADDINRQGEATPMQFINREKHHYGDDVSEMPAKEDVAERLFNQEQAIKDDVSNIGRSQLGSEMIYQEREDAYLDDKEWNEKKSRSGSQEEFFNREKALYSQVGQDQPEKNATETQFFKHDEAVRGDATSQDRSMNGTQMDYFRNVDTAELGRPDTYSINKSVSGSEFINKSDLARGASKNNNHGPATPHGNKEADPIEYMNKSEAEYGRPDSIMERDATMSKYFEQEQNPQFGRGDQYSRNAEMEKEYNPTPESDSSGRSESSEGGIANHSPFTSAVVIPKTSGIKPSPQVAGQQASKISHNANKTDPNLEQVRKVFQGNPGINNPRRFEEDQRNMPDTTAAIMPSPVKSRGGNRTKAPLNMTQQQIPGQVPLDPTTPQMLEPASLQQNQSIQQQRQQAKTILYSDKSETSVEDLMDDTPSNYNVANGRFEGKSLGLKAMLLHAKKYQNQTPDINANSSLTPVGGNLASQPILPHVNMAGGEPKPNRSPQHTRPGQMYASGMIGAQKGIIGSQHDERQFVNNLYQSQHSLGGQSSTNQWKVNGPHPLNASQAQTIDPDISADGDNSQMRNTRSVVRTNKQFTEDPRSQASGISPGADQRQSRGRGMPKVTKNNFLNGSIN